MQVCGKSDFAGGTCKCSLMRSNWIRLNTTNITNEGYSYWGRWGSCGGGALWCLCPFLYKRRRTCSINFCKKRNSVGDFAILILLPPGARDEGTYLQLWRQQSLWRRNSFWRCYCPNLASIAHRFSIFDRGKCVHSVLRCPCKNQECLVGTVLECIPSNSYTQVHGRVYWDRLAQKPSSNQPWLQPSSDHVWSR